MASITLLTGGARSGKSWRALELAMKYSHRVFIATAEAVDNEMEKRIEDHRKERADKFITIEEPRDPARALTMLDKSTKVAIIDCLTVWVGNLMQDESSGSFRQIDAFVKALDNPPCDLIIVTNEVGMGIVPENAMSRSYRDILGGLNRRIAEKADTVILMVCGCEIRIK